MSTNSKLICKLRPH